MLRRVINIKTIRDVQVHCSKTFNGFRWVSYVLILLATWMLNVAIIHQMVYQPDAEHSTFYLSETNPDSPSLPDNNYFLKAPDTPLAAISFQNISQVRVPVVIVKTENNPFFMLKSCFSSIIHRQFQTTQFINTAVYTQMEKDGYYIFALRKLLI